MKLFGKEMHWPSVWKGRRPKGQSVLAGLIPRWYRGRELFTDSDFSAQLQAYREWVYVAASRNAQTVAQVPLRLYHASISNEKNKRFLSKEVNPFVLKELLDRPYIATLSAVKKAVSIDEVVEHPILDLMKNVNNFMNAFDLWEITQLYQELTGNAYWLIINNGLKKPAEIWALPPDRIKVFPDPEKFIRGYVYEYGNYKQFIPEESIIHFKMPNPNNLYYGASPLTAVRSAYSIANKMNEYELAVFENMGRLEGYFYTDSALGNDEFDRLKLQLREAFIGHTKAGSTPLLESGLKYERFGLSPAELSYKEGRIEIKETILNAYGQTLGLYSASANRATAEAAQVQFTRQAIKPRLLRLEQKINEKLIPKWDASGRLFVAFDDCVPEDAKIAADIRADQVRTGQITLDEARKQLRLLPYPDDIGSEPLFQVQYAPLSAIVEGQTLQPASQPTPSKPNDADKEEADDDMDDEDTKAIIHSIAARLTPLVVNQIKRSS